MVSHNCLKQVMNRNVSLSQFKVFFSLQASHLNELSLCLSWWPQPELQQYKILLIKMRRLNFFCLIKNTALAPFYTSSWFFSYWSLGFNSLFPKEKNTSWMNCRVFWIFGGSLGGVHKLVSPKRRHTASGRVVSFSTTTSPSMMIFRLKSEDLMEGEKRL